MTLSERLKVLMKQSNISGKALSKKTGISRSSICLYLKGERLPKTEQTKRLAYALDVSPEYLLGLDKPLTLTSLTLEKDTHIECIFYDLVRYENNEDLKKLARYIKAYLNE